ncbi:transposase [Mesorhizobium sp. M0933]|uniref:transposase n=1 Tax=Mesorhizobium sp. M0933 TaxID=2957030 RepID=UPI00333D4119
MACGILNAHFLHESCGESYGRKYESASGLFEVLTAEPLKSRRKPRHWSDEDKARLVAEALAPGSNVPAIARSHGLDPSQVYAWRRKALASGAVSPLTEGDKLLHR